MIQAAVAARPARVLVIEDDADTAESTARLLKVFGHEVRVARDGQEGVAAALDWRPGFILLDLALPGTDGYQVAARLRREAACREAVIVAVSGYCQPKDRERSYVAGIDHHLVKPADWDVVLSLLSRPEASTGVDRHVDPGATMRRAYMS